MTASKTTHDALNRFVLVAYHNECCSVYETSLIGDRSSVVVDVYTFVLSVCVLPHARYAFVRCYFATPCI